MQNPIQQSGNRVLRPEVLEAINNSQSRLAIAQAMGLTENAIRKYIIRNDVKLTQYAPLEVIKKIMGCLDASEVLEPVNEIA